MTIPLKVRNNKRRRGRKMGNWPKLRFMVTVSFFLLLISGTFVGSTCSFNVGSVTISCPLGVIQVMAAARRIIPTLLLAGFIGFLLVVIFGRAFCSWICPGRWIFNRGPARNSKPWRARAWVQRAIVGGVVGAAWLCHTPMFCMICPAGVVCRGAIAAGTGGSILPTVGWFTAMLGAEFALGRSWCRDMCPLGAALSWFSRLNPFLKVKKNPETCIPCKACSQACPVGLNLSQDSDLSACTKCMACKTACPRNAIELKVL